MVPVYVEAGISKITRQKAVENGYFYDCDVEKRYKANPNISKDNRSLTVICDLEFFDKFKLMAHKEKDHVKSTRGFRCE